MKPEYYLLDEQGNPYPTDDSYQASLLMGNVQKRRVASDKKKIEDHEIFLSTVFLVFDHAFLDDTPVLFETMLFIDSEEIRSATRRYHTRSEAQEGHQVSLKIAEAALEFMTRNKLSVSDIVGLLEQ